MDKKVLMDIVYAIVAQVARENNVSEGEARCLLGIVLRNNGEALMNAAQIQKTPSSIS